MRTRLAPTPISGESHAAPQTPRAIYDHREKARYRLNLKNISLALTLFV